MMTETRLMVMDAAPRAPLKRDTIVQEGLYTTQTHVKRYVAMAWASIITSVTMEIMRQAMVATFTATLK